MTSLEQGVPTPTVKYRIPSVHPEGIKFVVIAAAVTLLFWVVLDWEILGWLMAMLTIWVAAFFRDPIRVTPQGTGLVVSPADGLVCQIADVEPPRQLSGEGGLAPGRHTRVSIFMSVFDVHINRTPIAGVLRRIVYVPGKFLNADLDKASEDNERQYFVVEGHDGVRIAFTQIAGLVARRIMRFVKEGDVVVSGARVGLIRFGSRVDVYLPAGTAPTVALGQRAIAGETVLGRLGSSDATSGIAQ
jgi:phosphatidylserine decarboxylase